MRRPYRSPIRQTNRPTGNPTMKQIRSFALLALPAALYAAGAQSSVTLYGIADAGIAYVHNAQNANGSNASSLVKFSSGNLSGSRWGCGTEDLGGGRRAVPARERLQHRHGRARPANSAARPSSAREQHVRHRDARPPVRSGRRSRAGPHAGQLLRRRVRDAGRPRQLRQQPARQQLGEIHGR